MAGHLPSGRSVMVAGLLVLAAGGLFSLVARLQVKAVEHALESGRRVEATIVEKEVVVHHGGKSLRKPSGEPELYILHTRLARSDENSTPAEVRVSREFYDSVREGETRKVVLPPRYKRNVSTMVYHDDPGSFVVYRPNMYIGAGIMGAGVLMAGAGAAMGGAGRRRQ